MRVCALLRISLGVGLVLLLWLGLIDTRAGTALAIDVNQFEVPTDRDETLFLVNWVEHIGWDLWPGEQASLADLQSWADAWHPHVVAFQERARLAGLHSELQNLLNNLRSFVEANQRYCTLAPQVPGMIDAETSRKRDQLASNMVEGVAELLLERLLGTPQSQQQAKVRVARRVFETSKDAVNFKLEAGQTAASWNASQRRDLALLRQDHESAARLSVAVMKVSRAWKPGETRFDGTGSQSVDSALASRVRDPFFAYPVFTKRAAAQTPFAAMSDAVMLYERARYVPEEPIYKAYQLYFLGGAAELATDAGARDQQYYSAPTKIPSRMAMKLWERFLDKTSDSDRPTVRQVMHLARANALNGRYDVAVTLMEICAKKAEFERDANFQYRYALMLSLVGKPTESLSRLSLAKTLGITDFRDAVNDPDLTTVRERHPTEFAKLLMNGS